jgi:predicted nucleic-acid-binding protein
MKLTSLDSNVVLRLILDDVPDQSTKATAFVGESPCYVTDVVVSECVFVLEKVYKLDRDRIGDLMTILFKLNTVTFNENIMAKTFELYRAWRPLSFVDCYSIVETVFVGNDLVTFDRALMKKGAPNAKEPK